MQKEQEDEGALWDYQDPPKNPVLFLEEWMDGGEDNSKEFLTCRRQSTAAKIVELLRHENEAARQADKFPVLRKFFNRHPSELEERLEWEFSELWSVIEFHHIETETLGSLWTEFCEADVRDTGSDVLDFGAFICSKYGIPDTSYYIS